MNNTALFLVSLAISATFPLPPIHRSTLLRECAAEGKTIFEMDELCRAAKQYQALTQHVMKF